MSTFIKSALVSAVLLPSLLVAAVSSFSQGAVTTKVDDLVRAEMAKQKIPGVSLAVVKNGKAFIVKGYGLANVEHNVAVKPETIFQSGSVGKQFTAMAVMILVDEGKIGLDEKIGRYLGEVPPSWANITVRHLLTHTSGMTDYPPDFDFRRDYTEDEILKQAKMVPTAFAPGMKWSYSNLGYMTLGVIIGKVTGKFYGEFLKERVFIPLGMTTARIISERDIVPNRAAGYVLRNGEIKNQSWVSPSINTTADGSLYLTTLDMVKWEEGLAAGKLIGKASYDLMWTPAKTLDGKEQQYGFGWALRSLHGLKVIEHSGSWQGFKSFIGRYPDNRLTIIVLANSANSNPDRIAASIAAILDPALKHVPIKDPDPQLSVELRRLFEDIRAGKIDSAKFTAEVAKALTDPNDRLLTHVKTLGTISRFELIETQGAGNKRGWKYAVDFDRMSIILELGRDKDGKIFHFVMQPQ